YYSPNQLKSEYFRGPDFFVVLGSDPQPRKSWVVWEENGKYPNVIIELLSDSTAKVDQGLKKEIYQDTFRTPNYFWFDPYTLELQGFELMAGSYQDLEPNEQGWLWCGQLQLFLGIHERQLRFFLPSGELVETPEEEAIAQQQQAEAEYQRAEAAQAQAEAERTQKERLATKLRELGVDPTSL
ncbi:MAG: Uma2 family endonuclease, partial [Cyanobacteria bacterium P01_H01_bin.58]